MSPSSNNKDETGPVYYGGKDKEYYFLNAEMSGPFISKEKIRYRDVHQYLGHQCAKLFGSHRIAAKILQADDPKAVNRLVQTLPDLDPRVWKKYELGINFTGFMYAMRQNDDFAEALLETGNRDIIHLTTDKDHGVGVKSKEEFESGHQDLVYNNKLGRLMMMVRRDLRAEQVGEELQG